jgi:hypothetical protein
MTRVLRALGAFCAGVGAMYLLDPERGRRRRALVRDKAVRLAHETEEAIEMTARDLANRSRGVMHAVGSIVASGTPDDDTLVQRVRSRIGRVVSHPRAIDVACRDGGIVLSGVVLERELGSLLRVARNVAGVTSVRNELEVHATADVPSLQGGGRRPGDLIDILQERWAPATRLIAGTMGAVLAITGARAGGAIGVVGVLGGGALFARSLSNTEILELLGIAEWGLEHDPEVTSELVLDALTQMQ